jgi:hypothetical protein
VAVTQEEAEVLIKALVGEKHRWRWQHSAEFHAEIRMLASLLPLWVDGMAAASDEADEAAKVRVAMARLADPPGFIDPNPERTAELRRRIQQEQS